MLTLAPFASMIIEFADYRVRFSRRQVVSLSRVVLILWVLVLVPSTVFAQPGTPTKIGFVTGFNQAWLHGFYGSQWVNHFDAIEARRLMTACKANGGLVFRMWLFEGLDPEGVVWDQKPQVKDPKRARVRPTGIDQRKLENLGRFLGIAEEVGVKVYLTLFDANICTFSSPDFDARKDEWWNVLNDEYGAGEGFRKNVVKPLLAVVAQHRSAVFGLDLCNEINAWVTHFWFKGGWAGARQFVTVWRGFIRGQVAVPVGASLGWLDAVPALLVPQLPPSLVDFYDFHVYGDGGKIPLAGKVQAFARTCGRPVYLGEFGQLSKAYDDPLQVKVTAAFVRAARAVGLAGAFAWRLSDIRPGNNPEARFSFEAFGKWRPAMATFRQVSAE
jgi:hypothetical protein